MSIKQKKIEIEPRIKLTYNISNCYVLYSVFTTYIFKCALEQLRKEIGRNDVKVSMATAVTPFVVTLHSSNLQININKPGEPISLVF